MGHSVVLDAFGAYQPTRVARAAPPASMTETTVIGNFPAKVEKIDGEIRQKLDEIISKARNLNLERVEIKAYAPVFKEFARPHARAAREYLQNNGIPADLISTKVRGNSGALARNWSVAIEIVGTPKPPPASAMPVTSLSPTVLL
ncbi:hypothetical protein BAU07_16790 [Bordetella flabilis]|uniref:OmpA-like domain-containing protein n=2 Tax=Bordetella flabilis TaxID=463014 RepID=A0A193GFG2_9BORD|nr:hypothetical protein BAU07_16790 [Bordetella flabilis]